MNPKRIQSQITRSSSNVVAKYTPSSLAANTWSTLTEIALAGWASTARLAVLLLVKQGTAGVVIFLILRR